jgi:hypothetical protein
LQGTGRVLAACFLNLREATVNDAALHSLSRLPLAVALAAALGVAALPGPAQATAYTVTTTGDAGNGTCAATD